MYTHTQEKTLSKSGLGSRSSLKNDLIPVDSRYTVSFLTLLHVSSHPEVRCPVSEAILPLFLFAVNEEWLEGHTAGNIGIFPRCFAYRDSPEKVTDSETTSQENIK